MSRIAVAGSIVPKLTTERKTEFPSLVIKRDCPACGGCSNQPHWRKGELQLARCLDCGMIFANPIQADMASGEFYDAEGADYYLSPAKLESDYTDVRFERELKLFRKLCRGGAVLDVGSGSGGFLFQLQKRWPGDYQTLGTDVSGAPLDYAESRGVPVARGNFLECDFAGRSFDAVTFWAVVEHLANPKRFLEKTHSLLKPNGICFVLVPNFKSLASQLLGMRYRYVYPQHLNYFTRETLATLCSTQFDVMEAVFTHFNPLVIWHDWRGGGRDVSNQERGALLRQTTALKQKTWMKPVKLFYDVAEKILGTIGLADNLVLVLKKK